MSTECHETGVVERLESENKALVTIQRAEACGSCVSKGACQVLGGQTKDFSLVLNNEIGAQVGDTVRITIKESAVVKASAVLYLIPALFLVSGAIAGNRLSGIMHWAGDPGSVAGALIGLGTGFLFTYIIGKKLGGSGAIAPELTRIVNSNVQGEHNES